MTDISNCIACIYEVRRSVYRARVLFDGCTKPIDLLCPTGHKFHHVYKHLTSQYPRVQVLTDQEFQNELDFIALFGYRSSASVQEMLNVIDNGPPNLTDEELEVLLNQADELSKWIEAETKRLEEQYGALLFSGSMESEFDPSD